MQLNPYLTFNGDCEQALKFYEQNSLRISAFLCASAVICSPEQ